MGGCTKSATEERPSYFHMPQWLISAWIILKHVFKVETLLPHTRFLLIPMLRQNTQTNWWCKIYLPRPSMCPASRSELMLRVAKPVTHDCVWFPKYKAVDFTPTLTSSHLSWTITLKMITFHYSYNTRLNVYLYTNIFLDAMI